MKSREVEATFTVKNYGSIFKLADAGWVREDREEERRAELRAHINRNRTILLTYMAWGVGTPPLEMTPGYNDELIAAYGHMQLLDPVANAKAAAEIAADPTVWQ